MDTNTLIRALNAFTEPHFTNGGHHMGTGDMSRDGLVLAAWYARSALDDGASIVARVCHLLRAKEELGKVHLPSVRSGELTGVTPQDLENVLNAIAWGTSLVCDAIRVLESKKARKPR